MQYDMSVIVPIHGRVNLFRETIQSLEMQSYDNFEVIFTDDTQNKNEREEIKGLISNFTKPYRYIFTAPNLGQVGNTNQGLKEASGRYMRILHSDDLLHPETIAFEVAIFNKFQDESDFIFHRHVNFNDSKKIEFDIDDIEYTLRNPKTLLLQMLPYDTAIPSAMVIKNEFLRNNQLQMNNQYYYLCDAEFFYQILMASHENRRKILEISSGYVYWRVHSDSVSGRGMIIHYNEAEKLLPPIYEKFLKTEFITRKKYDFIIENIGVRKINTLLWEIKGRGNTIKLQKILQNIFLTKHLWCKKIPFVMLCILQKIIAKKR